MGSDFVRANNMAVHVDAPYYVSGDRVTASVLVNIASPIQSAGLTVTVRLAPCSNPRDL